MNFTHVLVMRMPIRYVLYIDKAPKNVSALKTILLGITEALYYTYRHIGYNNQYDEIYYFS